MKLSNIIKIAGVVTLIICACSCETKKQKEAAERARIEAEEAAAAAAQAAADSAAAAAARAAELAARVFEMSDSVKAVSCADKSDSCAAYTAEDFNAKYSQSIKANAYGATTLAYPAVIIKYAAERCDLTAAQRDAVKAFAQAYNQSDKTATILVETYCADSKDKEYNDQMSIERGACLKALLVKSGVDRHNIQVIANNTYKTNKAFPNAKWAEKRRAVISIK